MFRRGLYARGTLKWESETLRKLRCLWRRQFGHRWAEPSRKGVLIWGLVKDKDIGVIQKLLVSQLKAAVSQSTDSNQPFVCPCALVGGRLSRCNCDWWWLYCVAWQRVPAEIAHHTSCFWFLALGNLAPVPRADSSWLYQGPVLPVHYSQELDTFWWESMSCSGNH